MDELSRELREAFDRQQAALGSLAGARERVIRAALAQPEDISPRRLQLAGGVVALLLAAAIVGTMMVLARSHGGVQPARAPVAPTAAPAPTPVETPVPTPSVSPAGTHLTQPLSVAPTVPVILFRDGSDPSQLDGITWDGQASGRVATLDPHEGIYANPGGTLYATMQDVRDRSGTIVVPAENYKAVGRFWADDGRHYCRVSHASTVPPPGGEPASLQIAAPGEQTRQVAQIGTVYEQAGVSVRACSLEQDRAVVVQAGGQGVSDRQVWVVQLSTGRVLWTRSYASDGSRTVNVRASRDGQYLAEVTGTCCQQGSAGAASTTVYGPTGSVVGHVDGSVAAFSWDGTLAVRASAPSNGVVSVIRWRDGVVLWTSPDGLTYSDSLAEPGGQHLAVSLRDPAIPQTSGFPTVDLYVVGSDGQAHRLLHDVRL